MLIKTCPNNCSGHGVCNNDGICACDIGFSEVDCSINLNDVPKITCTSTNSTTIDSSIERPTSIILCLSHFVSENPNSKIKVTVYVRKNESLEPEISFDLTGYSLSIQITYLELESVTANVSKEWYVLKFEATNNGQNYSQPLKMMVFPKSSYKCNSDADDFSCEKLVNLFIRDNF